MKGRGTKVFGLKIRGRNLEKIERSFLNTPKRGKHEVNDREIEEGMGVTLLTGRRHGAFVLSSRINEDIHMGALELELGRCRGVLWTMSLKQNFA
jgi:hypothetical protein